MLTTLARTLTASTCLLVLATGAFAQEGANPDVPTRTHSGKVSASRDPRLPPAYGPIPAKVTVLVFSDFQCPVCRRITDATHQIAEEWPGDVRLEFRQLALVMHANAANAAVASLAAHRQGKFWEMHDIMFQNSRELTFDKLKEYAGKIGLDVARWEKDYNAPETQQEVEKDMTAGRSADVSGTPTFFVNGKRATNRSVDGFKDMIEAAMKGSDKKG